MVENTIQKSNQRFAGDRRDRKFFRFLSYSIFISTAKRLGLRGNELKWVINLKLICCLLEMFGDNWLMFVKCFFFVLLLNPWHDFAFPHDPLKETQLSKNILTDTYIILSPSFVSWSAYSCESLAQAAQAAQVAQAGRILKEIQDVFSVMSESP